METLFLSFEHPPYYFSQWLHHFAFLPAMLNDVFNFLGYLLQCNLLNKNIRDNLSGQEKGQEPR